jgi:hypothetical protein
MANYLQNEDLVNELRRCRGLGYPSAELAIMFTKIATHRSNCYKYDDPEDKRDCISGAVEIMIKKWDKFNLDADTNAFSYYTQVATNGLYHTWNQISRGNDVTYSYDRVFHENTI